MRRILVVDDEPTPDLAIAARLRPGLDLVAVVRASG